MSHTAVSPMSRTRRLRAAAVAMHGGASSLLRLTQPSSLGRLPSRSTLNVWAQRAATSLDTDPGALDAPSSEPFITPLLPSAALAWR
jgi:hypothetical protein